MKVHPQIREMVLGVYAYPFMNYSLVKLFS